MSDDSAKKLKAAEAQQKLRNAGGEIKTLLGEAEAKLKDAGTKMNKLTSELAEVLHAAGGTLALDARKLLISEGGKVVKRADDGKDNAKGALDAFTSMEEEVLRKLLVIISATG